MGRRQLRHHEALSGRDWVIYVKPFRGREQSELCRGKEGHDQSNWLDNLGVQFMCIFIFFDSIFSTGSMMQNQTQWLTSGSMNPGRVPVSWSTSCCVSAKAHQDTEIFWISLSIILMKHFCFPF